VTCESGKKSAVLKTCEEVNEKINTAIAELKRDATVDGLRFHKTVEEELNNAIRELRPTIRLLIDKHIRQDGKPTAFKSQAEADKRLEELMKEVREKAKLEFEYKLIRQQDALETVIKKLRADAIEHVLEPINDIFKAIERPPMDFQKEVDTPKIALNVDQITFQGKAIISKQKASSMQKIVAQIPLLSWITSQSDASFTVEEKDAEAMITESLTSFSRSLVETTDEMVHTVLNKTLDSFLFQGLKVVAVLKEALNQHQELQKQVKQIEDLLQEMEQAELLLDRQISASRDDLEG